MNLKGHQELEILKRRNDSEASRRHADGDVAHVPQLPWRAAQGMPPRCAHISRGWSAICWPLPNTAGCFECVLVWANLQMPP